jgi:stalled ribosome rescue protein Dom34
MSHYHAVLWMDHAEARVFHVTKDASERIVLHPRAHHHAHQHGTRNKAHTECPQDFLHTVVEAMQGAQEWLVTGPGDAKHQFVRHVESHDPQLRARIVAVENADHPTDGQIIAHARKAFEKIDRMRA